MTFYEHAMLGINSTLALGLQKRYDWQIIALAGTVAVLPDWDGLTILLNTQCFSEGHRVWGHNIFAAAIMAVVVFFVFYKFNVFENIKQWLAAHSLSFVGNNNRINDEQSNRGQLIVWIIIGIAAAYSHLFADMLFSIGKNLPVWGVPLFWPFSAKEFAYPAVSWGDVVPTIIFAASMFVMLRWPKSVSKTAFASILLVVCYICI